MPPPPGGVMLERVGTLAMFNPKDRLDRIEISQVTNSKSAMGRWVARHGQ